MFWKLLVAQTIVVAILTIVAELVMSQGLVPALIRERQDSLAESAARIAERWSAAGQAPPPIAERALPGPPLDLQWIKANAIGALEPAHRTQVESTLSGVPAAWMEPTEDGYSRILFRAEPVKADGKVDHILLLKESLADIDRLLSGWRKSLVALLALGIGVSFVVARLMAGRWSKRIESVKTALVHLPGGQAAAKTGRFRDEFSELARTVDRTRAQLAEQIRGIDQVRRDLQSMLETIPDAVLAIDPDQRVLFANPSTYRLFDLPPHDISGQKLWEILRQPGLQDAVTITFASREPTTTEFEIRYPPRVLSFHGRSLAVGNGRGIIIVLHDVTELRRLERMRQEFFASVSHELKTPLAAIKAYTETLLDEAAHEPDVVARFLGRIEEQADRLHTLVIDMLTLARVESEDHGFDIKPIELARTVEASVEHFHEKAEAKQIRLTVDLAADSGTVLADAEGLGMIVRNLVDNAIKYTPTEGWVTVSTRREGGSAVIRVADSGVGIPSDDLTRIFERFYRVDKARSRELGGTGLGLSIVKHLVSRFGGQVSVRSRLQEGSTFSITLPSSPNPAEDSPYGSAADLERKLKQQEALA